MSINFDKETFPHRHIGPSDEQIAEMLDAINADSLEQLIDETVPTNIRLSDPLNLEAPMNEHQFLNEFKKLADQNEICDSYIGMGYHDTITPNVILRNVIENPGWYTAYTPYQAEIAQGRLEALLNFQTMVTDLTGRELANASLLDEGTAAAEAMSMLYSMRRGVKRKQAHTFFVSEQCHPQTIDIIKGRAEPLDIEVIVGDHHQVDVTDQELFSMLLQYPTTDGSVEDYTHLIDTAHEHNINVVVAADLLSLTLLTPPGEMGADVVVGSTQRFGVPMGYGGPHAAYFATRKKYKRKVPGRIIGLSKNREGQPAYRMALQTREQHIRRERATSNICTAQVFLAVIAGFYGIYHGPNGLRRIAERIHGLAKITELGLQKLGFEQENSHYFDTLRIPLSDKEKQQQLRSICEHENINLRYFEDPAVGISFDENKTLTDVKKLLNTFAQLKNTSNDCDVKQLSKQVTLEYPDALKRNSDYMQQAVFNCYHSEHEMLRYLKRLENKDLSLTHSMIPLGSCTMKLNATTEMIPLTWPEFSKLHPYAPQQQAKGYQQLFSEVEDQLSAITGLPAVSLQPNSGAQGELCGLMTIRAYHRHQGEQQRNVTIIPESAHGTNPASASMAGMEVIVTACHENGNIGISELKKNVKAIGDKLAAIMVTYPSTHGVFEKDIQQICQLVHNQGGLVYLDGANMNAQLGFTNMDEIGADICHLNLHKTFSIPHGGGGPGVGPVAATKKLGPFLPGNPLEPTDNKTTIHNISAAQWGSAGILPISYSYIKMMGSSGLRRASQVAILNANYLKERLQDHYPILYANEYGRAAHEFIIDLRPFRESAGIGPADVAKRLMDYGYHAPTISFPVAGTLMIEPTESESKHELDRFCKAMIAIRKEIKEIEDGMFDTEDNVLKGAPHTIRLATDCKWPHSYPRKKAFSPLDYLQQDKFWPTSSRIDDAYGDRNLICNCLSPQKLSDWQKQSGSN
ncbi:aminomethyl-transferring glycine dehydrogenase [Fodinibius halophilus]|uniref:Glycine dehydrogenase (decarboxylating) n=1 Tax=Fodinibius halophilus TaxID=1736908 RepID=A0A6M1T3P4_9BACT|nr:aminomethyl-transferring glycine dehydrogenase [Fodinibius halophilus]NGP88697.1 aminomethyl-transferring glycine dehydrogenase [Fodinibius halophilus]